MNKLLTKINQWLKGYINIIEVAGLLFAIVGLYVGFHQMHQDNESTKIALNSYKIALLDQMRQKDPMLSFNFIENSIEANVNQDFEIKDVLWLLPDDDGKGVKINQSSNNLSINELAFALDWQWIEKENVSHQQRINFIKCKILGGSIEGGLPLVVQVELRRRGEKESMIVNYLTHIKGAIAKNPYIIIDKPGAATEDVGNFIKDGALDIKKYFQVIDKINFDGIVNDSGECRMIIGAPVDYVK
ncbi:MAG: hypothetical protein WA093_04310 [Minisyncoccales bacterium]